MNMKMICAALLVACAWMSGAAEWRGLTEANWYSGRKLTASDLQGKVVLVDKWGVNCGPCVALLPEIEKIWQTYKSKPFILIGSHCQGREPDAIAALVKKNGLSYPIYDDVGIEGEPHADAIPFLYVVDAKGQVVFSGVGAGAVRGAIEAVVNALEGAMDRFSLTGNVTPVKLKSLARQLVMGKSCESVVRQLKQTAKGRDAKAEEAKALIQAVEETQTQVKKAIEGEIKERPAAALANIALYRQTWPSDAKAYDDAFKTLSADADVKKAVALRALLVKYRDFAPKNASAAKTALAAVKKAAADAEALGGASANAAVGREAASYAGELAEIAKDLAAEAAPKRK